MNKYALFVLSATLILLLGCVSQPSSQLPPLPSPPSLVGNDRDSHGCIGSAGYTWCEASQKCYRSWEENCTAAATRQCKTVSGCGSGAARCVNGTCTQYDEHGCVPDGGYTWCEALKQCIQPWMTNCTAAAPALEGGDSALGRNSSPTLAGNDRDSHGCIASAGYSWCPEKGKCLRVWEEACNATDRFANAEEHCADANVAQVSVCGQHVKVVSSLMGGGSTFYSDDGTEVRCPLVAPDAMTEQCRLLMLGDNCVDQVVDCSKANVPGAVTDLKDDPNFVGAQLTWSAPDSNAVDYEIFRASQDMSTVSLIKTTGQASYNEVFNANGSTFAYFVRARNAAGAESPVSNIVYVQQLAAPGAPSPGQID